MRRIRLLPDDPQLGWTPWAWLVYLFPFASVPAFIPQRPEIWVPTILATLAFLILYFAGFWSHGKRLMIIIAAILVIGCAFLPSNLGAGVFFIYAASFAAWVDRTSRTTVLLVAVVSAILVVEALLLDLEVMRWIWALVFSILVAALNLHSVQTSKMNARLRMAQHEIEQLAKVAERERITRDLHDVLGHTLSLIVLKSELASKLAERDPSRAASEIRDVERISRDALGQVRAALSGYRAAGLVSELDSAREVLTTAGIEPHVERNTTAFSAAEEAVLSLAVREAVTNVIRHSQASRCTITIGQSDDGGRAIVVRDNGRGIRGARGLGLTGMNERVRAIGGIVELSSDGGTSLSIKLPPQVAERAS
jgi:two-component system sensor histidine kinase DesK